MVRLSMRGDGPLSLISSLAIFVGAGIGGGSFFGVGDSVAPRLLQFKLTPIRMGGQGRRRRCSASPPRLRSERPRLLATLIRTSADPRGPPGGGGGTARGRLGGGRCGRRVKARGFVQASEGGVELWRYPLRPNLMAIPPPPQPDAPRPAPPTHTHTHWRRSCWCCSAAG